MPDVHLGAAGIVSYWGLCLPHYLTGNIVYQDLCNLFAFLNMFCRNIYLFRSGVGGDRYREGGSQVVYPARNADGQGYPGHVVGFVTVGIQASSVRHQQDKVIAGFWRLGAKYCCQRKIKRPE